MSTAADRTQEKREVADAIIEAFLAFNEMTPGVLIHDLSSLVGRSGEGSDSLGLGIASGQRDPAVKVSKKATYWAQWLRQNGEGVVDSRDLQMRLQELIDCLALSLLALRRPRDQDHPPPLTSPRNLMALLEDEQVLKWLATHGSPELISRLG